MTVYRRKASAPKTLRERIARLEAQPGPSEDRQELIRGVLETMKHPVHGWRMCQAVEFVLSRNAEASGR